MKRNLFSLSTLILLLTLVLTQTASARKFYFSSVSGSNSRTLAQAQNITTPWASVSVLGQYITSGRNTFMPGDTFAFKCGEVFANGPDQYFGSLKWWNRELSGSTYFTAPSGTAQNPIVFTSYGTGDKPNFLFPYPSTSTQGTNQRHRYCLTFEGVKHIIFDGLQFNDFRFNINDKVTPAFTSAGLLLGENSEATRVKNITVRNCYFSNIGYGIISTGDYITIENNVFINLKSVGDTSGNTDIGSDPIQPSGSHYLIKGNYMKGGWSYSGSTGTGGGKVGGAIEVINDFDSSLIIYNTMIDHDGAMEFGSNTGVTHGADDDTFAYNIFINTSVIAYYHTGSSYFAANHSNQHYWNNVWISNNKSRMSGPSFGTDTYGDGQSFSQFLNWPTLPRNPTPNNYGGWRVIQYTSDAGVSADTIIDMRNNILWCTHALQMKYSGRTKIKYRNNLYRLSGGAILGAALDAGEILTTNKIFSDTSSVFPENWDLKLLPNSPAINMGMIVPGNYEDFAGNPITGNPDAGIYEYVNSSINVQPLNATSSFTPILCFNGTTTVNVTATGGTPPYTGTGSFTVGAGNYRYVVSDVNGLKDTVTLTITQPTVITPEVIAGTITIAGGTTSVTVNASGGVGNPYEYKLNSGAFQTSNIFNNVSAGTHTVSVKDINGCMGARTFTINAPTISPLTVTVTNGNISCNGGTTTVNVSATGGVAPYTGVGTFTVSAGTYSYTVRDANGTAVTRSVTITQPSVVVANAVSGSISQFGGTTSITASGSGGVSPYMYQLNTGSFQTSTVFNSVTAGNYVVTVRDANNCTRSTNITVSQPAMVPLNATATASAINCFGENSTVQVSATGGIAPYTGIGSFTVRAGTYSYIVTDAMGNRDTAVVNILQPSIIGVSVNAGTISVAGGTTTVTAVATGGTPTYSYSLNNGAYQASNQFNSVPAGNHVINVRDSKGCISNNPFVIQAPIVDPLKIITTVGKINCFGGTALVTVTATGGIPPYTGTGTFSYVAGNYTLTVRDANGNTASSSIVIAQPSSINVVANDITDIRSTTGLSTYNITASGGVPPYRYSMDGGAQQTSSIFSGITSGTHTFSVIDSNNCIKVITVNVAPIASSPLTLNLLSKSDISCKGAQNGKIEVLASGGRAPYQYAIKNSAYGTSNVFTNLSPGFYRVFVRDASQTIASIVVRINDNRTICTTTGRSALSVNVFPNPTNNYFSLKLEAENNEDAFVEVFNNLGTKVYSAKTQTNSTFRFGDQFRPGYYIVNITHNNVRYSQKVIKL